MLRHKQGAIDYPFLVHNGEALRPGVLSESRKPTFGRTSQERRWLRLDPGGIALAPAGQNSAFGDPLSRY